MKITHVVGARPNFMKAAPVMAALAKRSGMIQELVHTGQHYDKNMSEVFFTQLDLPKPSINLRVGSGSHAFQTAHIMLHLEATFKKRQPDIAIVYGDVNSTLAAAIVCSKIGIPVGHVEAGLRSFDRTMPEEVNRVLTDCVSEILFTPSADADQNLLNEGKSISKIHCVGNVMIDTLKELLPKAEVNWPKQEGRLGVRTGNYGLVTLHRASNVDSVDCLLNLLNTLRTISRKIPLLFPVHPRTREMLARLSSNTEEIHFLEPQGYLEFLSLQKHCCFVITDSGGIQEETTYLGVPCITVRKNTERPITLTLGTNHLIGNDMGQLSSIVEDILIGKVKKGIIPPLWDGKSSERIADILEQHAF
jgi:UDP-N-acetylglucosamine 2-epimerase (non-hydrolysing)